MTQSTQFWLAQLRQHRAIAVIRSPSLDLAVQMAKATAAGGMQFIEITWNSDRAADTIQTLRSQLPDCTIGAGTLRTLDRFHDAIAAGAQFLFSPHVDPKAIETARNANLPIIPGALTPTEILTAWQAGATAVKVFPSSAVGGANYIRSLQGPLGDIPLIPTGGVTLDNTRDFLDAGAIAVGLSSDLFPKTLVAAEDWDAIARRTQAFIQSLANP